jgi:hypothetical protein
LFLLESRRRPLFVSPRLGLPIAEPNRRQL